MKNFKWNRGWHWYFRNNFQFFLSYKAELVKYFWWSRTVSVVCWTINQNKQTHLSGANLSQSKALLQNQGSDAEDKGVVGVLQQGHRGKGLQDLDVQDLASR
jgi:hypothetical protein